MGLLDAIFYVIFNGENTSYGGIMGVFGGVSDNGGDSDSQIIQPLMCQQVLRPPLQITVRFKQIKMATI